jgi:hypothetical protein
MNALDVALKNTKGMALAKDRIERFQASFRGEVIQPADFAYEKARKIWNASIDKHPGIIARCAGIADVMAAVNFARENGLLVAVRGGGHNVSGRALCNEGIVIDLSGMKGIHVNAKNRTATVEGGAVEPPLVIWIGRLMSLAWPFQQELCPRQVSLGSR